MLQKSNAETVTRFEWERIRWRFDVDLRGAADAAARPVAVLPAGTVTTVLTRNAEWLFVQDDYGNEGWVSRAPRPQRAGSASGRALRGAAGVVLIALLAAFAWSLRPTSTVPGPTVASAPTLGVPTAVRPTPAAAISTGSNVDERFAGAPRGWPNLAGGTAWYANGSYVLQPREPGKFVAIDAPDIASFDDGSITARFHKTGGPPGGGYGVVIADQNGPGHDGVFQGGTFVVFEVGDTGTFGVWQRNGETWIDLVTWTAHAAVRPGDASNELTVQARGRSLTFLVNGIEVTRMTAPLPAGRVGVFVGGDGNQVALERFTATTADIVASAAPTVPATQVPTPVVPPLLDQLDTAWARSDWPEVFRLLDRIDLVSPRALDVQEKRYAAHVLAGSGLVDSGHPAAAVDEFTAAQAIDPSRGEARVALAALTPTPVPTPIPALPQADKPLSEFTNAVLNDIDEFWSLEFSQRGRRYVPPIRHPFAKRTMTTCGVASPGVAGSFYCPSDSGLYLDLQFLGETRSSSEHGDFPVAYVLAHEAAHNVQHLFGISKTVAYIVYGAPFSREIELQADCLAGVWSKSAANRKLAEPEDITQALTLAWEIGDPTWASQRTWDAHGTPDDRSAAFLLGFNGSTPQACGLR